MLMLMPHMMPAADVEVDVEVQEVERLSAENIQQTLVEAHTHKRPYDVLIMDAQVSGRRGGCERVATRATLDTWCPSMDVVMLISCIRHVHRISFLAAPQQRQISSLHSHTCLNFVTRV